MRPCLAAGAWGAAALLTLGAIVLGAGIEEASDLVPFSLLTMAIATSGLVVVWRLPQQRVGWLLCFLGAWYGVAEFGQGYGLHAAEAGWPAAELGQWIVSWSWIVDLATWVLIILLFPDGRLPARHWRLVAHAAVLGCVLAAPGYTLSSSANADFASGRNPLLVESPVIDVAFGLGLALLFGALAGSVVSLVLRLRRARGIERQQLKCFAAAAVAFLIVAPSALAFRDQSIVAEWLIGIALLSLPASAAVAMLRYRLYDIDVVINRALVYGALTATLAAAGLFGPARRPIQAIVDRRFYRSRYDATRTLERFGSRLRDEVSLAALSEDLRAVVADTMQPAHISLWLREAGR